MYYQPKISLSTQRIIDVEALVRWRHPERGVIAADHFIPLAEQTGLIRPLTSAVIPNYCWPDQATASSSSL
jgi:EAL domain-containing protein (putative c-di-GMP-specific phosphodiesterase class I)